MSYFIVVIAVQLAACFDDRCVSMLWHKAEQTYIGPVVNIRKDFVLLASSIIEIMYADRVSIQNDLEVLYKQDPSTESKAQVIAYFRYRKRQVTLMPETSPHDVAILKTTPMPELLIWCPVANKYPIPATQNSFFVSFDQGTRSTINITLSSKRVKPLVLCPCYPFSDDMSAYLCTELRNRPIELGAPFFVTVRGDAVLFGIAAFKLSECEGELVYITNVVPAKRWILDVIKGTITATSPRRRTLNQLFSVFPVKDIPKMQFISGVQKL